jgi:hypothetical protein
LAEIQESRFPYQDQHTDRIREHVLVEILGLQDGNTGVPERPSGSPDHASEMSKARTSGSERLMRLHAWKSEEKVNNILRAVNLESQVRPAIASPRGEHFRVIPEIPERVL